MKCLLLIVSNFSLFTQWCRGMFSHKLKLVVFWRTVFYSSLFLFTYFLVCTWLEVFLPSSSGWGSQQSSRNKQLSFFSYRQEKEKVVGWKGKCSHSGAIRLIKVYSRVIPSLSLSLSLSLPCSRFFLPTHHPNNPSGKRRPCPEAERRRPLPNAGQCN
jgi:hypothetical protein